MRPGHLNVWIISDKVLKTLSYIILITDGSTLRGIQNIIFLQFMVKNITLYAIFVWSAFLFFPSHHINFSHLGDRNCSNYVRLFVSQLRTRLSYLSPCWHPPEHNTPLWLCDFHLCPIHETTSVQEAASEASQLWKNPPVRKHCGGCKQFEKERRTWSFLLTPVSQT